MVSMAVQKILGLVQVGGVLPLDIKYLGEDCSSQPGIVYMAMLRYLCHLPIYPPPVPLLLAHLLPADPNVHLKITKILYILPFTFFSSSQ